MLCFVVRMQCSSVEELYCTDYWVADRRSQCHYGERPMVGGDTAPNRFKGVI